MAKNGWKLSKVAITEYPVAFGQKREIVGVDQSDTTNNILCRYCFQGTSVFGQKHRELPFLAIAQKKTVAGQF